MNAKEFFYAVVDMRKKGKAYYAHKLQDSKKKELLNAALAAEKVVDDEILRVLAIMSEKQNPTLNLDGQQ